MRKKNYGKCHICGNEGPLTFEHVPPKAAFNDRPILMGKFEDMINKGMEPITHGKIQQQGAGGYTLCAKCNNNAGAWYGREFVNWCYQALMLCQRSGGSISIYYPFYIFPLRVIKQIICMFFSVNSSKFREKHQYLEKFVLNPEERYLPPSIRIYTYIMTGRMMRRSGINGILRFRSSGTQSMIFSEIAFPPLGYIMTIESPPPDERLFDITYFSNYGYNDWDTVYLKLPILPVHLYFPGDFRNEKEIQMDVIKNEIDEKLLRMKRI